MKIKTDDTVKVLLGKDKGRAGQVIASLPRSQKVLVKGVNVFKKHLKASQNQQGGIVDRPVPIHISKLILICPNCQKTTRVGYKIDKSGQKYRICKKCQQIIQKKIK